jgi:hypothetical protein
MTLIVGLGRVKAEHNASVVIPEAERSEAVGNPAIPA